MLLEGAGAGGAEILRQEKGNKPPGSSPPRLPEAARGPSICLSAPHGHRGTTPPRLPHCVRPLRAVRRGQNSPRAVPACPAPRTAAAPGVRPARPSAAATAAMAAPAAGREGGSCARR